MIKLLIFIVEDDEDECFFIKEALAMSIDDLDKQTRFFKNGIELLKEMSNKNCSIPDFILMDINIPVLNGIETLKYLKRNPVLKNIPVVILSKNNSNEEVAICIQNGACNYITRPQELNDYPVLLNNLLIQQVEIAKERGIERSLFGFTSYRPRYN